MLNDITIQWMEISLLTTGAAALISAGALHLKRVKAESSMLTGAVKTGVPVPKIVKTGSDVPRIRSFVPKIVGVSQFKKTAQMKYRQASAISQRLLMAVQREMGVTPPDETPV